MVSPVIAHHIVKASKVAFAGRSESLLHAQHRIWQMISCSAHTLTAIERQQQKDTWRLLLRSAHRTAIENGNSFEFSTKEVPLVLLGNLMDIERRCCGFAELELRVMTTDTAVFSFRGPQGTKDVLDAQIDIFAKD
jgi:hypothetical protein